jgi:hypothetical protein
MQYVHSYLFSNFLVSNTPSYGNCYTFNSELNSDDTYAGKRLNAMTGPQFGLMLVLNLDQSAYMTGGQTKQASLNWFMFLKFVYHITQWVETIPKLVYFFHSNHLITIRIHTNFLILIASRCSATHFINLTYSTIGPFHLKLEREARQVA